MSWKKYMVWGINLFMIGSILAAIFSAIVLIQSFNEIKERYITIASPKLEIIDQNKFIPDGEVQVKIKNDKYKHTRFKISHGQLALSFKDVSFNWTLAYIILRFLFLLLALYFVREIVRTADNPFIKRNVNRLRTLAVLLILYPVFGLAEQLIGRWFLERNFELVGMRFEGSADFNWPVLIAGFFLMIIAHVFKNGIEIKKEQALTI